MSCMEHECTECHHLIMNNESAPGPCPECGGRMVSYFDEAPYQGDEDEEHEA